MKNLFNILITWICFTDTCNFICEFALILSNLFECKNFDFLKGNGKFKIIVYILSKQKIRAHWT
jgi:hypothetical protein